MVHIILNRYKDDFQTLHKAWLKIILSSKDTSDVKIALNISWNLLATEHSDDGAGQEIVI